MNDGEFQTWYRRHVANYPGIQSWLARLSDSSGGVAVQGADVLAAWHRILRTCELSDAIDASDRMAVEAFDAPYEKHPAEVRRRAVWRCNHRKIDHSREQAFRDAVPCLRCKGAGTVPVYSRKVVDAVREHRQPFAMHAHCVVACGCTAGDRWLLPAADVRWPGGRRAWGLPHWTPDHYCLWRAGRSADERISEVTEWLASGQQPEANT